MAEVNGVILPPLRARPKVMVGQLRILLEALEDDPSLYNSWKSDMITIMNVEKWLDLADKLNEYEGGAKISVAGWKYVLRYWSVNTKKKRECTERTIARARNITLTREEARELAELEERFYRFIKREESREVLDVSFQDIPDQIQQTEGENIPESMKFIVEMFNIFSNEDEENTAPRKRALVLKRRAPNGAPENAKEMKLVINSVAGGRAIPHRVVIENDMNVGKLHVVSRELEEHISTIQNRIHMIKDLWKHRCGDN